MVMYFSLGIFSLNKTVLSQRRKQLQVFRFSSFFNLAKDRFLFTIIFYTISNPFFSELRKTSVRSLAKEDSLLVFLSRCLLVSTDLIID